MKTKHKSRHAMLEQSRRKRAKNAQSYWRDWVKVGGLHDACEWMAGHIGWIWAENEDLRRRVRALERKTKHL